MADYINVTSLNRLARQVLAQCEPLNDLIVCGEISGFVRHYKSGHMYFTLKDETASVKSVMFRNSAQLLNFQPQNGMLVLARGYAMVEKDGAVSEVAALQPGDAITLRGAAVRADCVVQSVHKNAQGGMTL